MIFLGVLLPSLWCCFAGDCCDAVLDANHCCGWMGRRAYCTGRGILTAIKSIRSCSLLTKPVSRMHCGVSRIQNANSRRKVEDTFAPVQKCPSRQCHCKHNNVPAFYWGQRCNTTRFKNRAYYWRQRSIGDRALFALVRYIIVSHQRECLAQHDINQDQ